MKVTGRALALPVAALTVAALTVAALAVAAATGPADLPAGPSPFWLVILRWAPLLLRGFVLNIALSVAAMLIGTAAGIPLGLLQVSPSRPLRAIARGTTQLFRNSPWLVLLFLCMYLLPYAVHVGRTEILLPDYGKAILGFSLPVMANVSEIVRGAVASVPSGQWDAARALGLTSRQAYRRVVLPQCLARMLPPWMNLYSLIVMSTVTASIVGVTEMLTLTGQVLAAEGSRTDLVAPLYAFAMLCFFAYCYPIGRLTLWLERRQARA